MTLGRDVYRMTTTEQALHRARVAVRLPDEVDVARAWGRLERDFGWPMAAHAWRVARHEVNREREATICDGCGRVITDVTPRLCEDCYGNQ